MDALAFAPEVSRVHVPVLQRLAASAQAPTRFGERLWRALVDASAALSDVSYAALGSVIAECEPSSMTVVYEPAW